VEKFLAPQPVFNSERDVYGYELLFRSGPGNFFDGSHPEAAAASAVDSLFLFGIDRLTHAVARLSIARGTFFSAISQRHFPPIASFWKSSRRFSPTMRSSPLAAA
jgi:hypothetical protein